MSYIGAPFLYIHKIDYFFHIVLFSNFWKISDFPGKNCQFCEYKKSELQYNSWHHERPEKNLLTSVRTITYRIWIKSIFWNFFYTVMWLWFYQYISAKNYCFALWGHGCSLQWYFFFQVLLSLFIHSFKMYVLYCFDSMAEMSQLHTITLRRRDHSFYLHH